MRALIATKALLPEGQTLPALLNDGDKAALAAALAANGLPAGGFDRFQPWWAAAALSILPLSKLGYDPANGVDGVLAGKADAPGPHEGHAKPHEALETPEMQLGLFAALPQATQIGYLHQVLAEQPNLKAEQLAMISAWRQGAVERLGRLINSDQDSPEMRARLLIDRNTAWAKWIGERVAHPHAPHEVLFIAVGAGHLAGNDSLIAQLARAGLRAHRVQ